MKLFKSKAARIGLLLGANSVVLSAAVIVSTISWYAADMNIFPDVDSGIVLSYFDRIEDAPGDLGSSTNPYVITRPIHYYNLVHLMETNYEGFNGNSTYFQFGKDLDDSGINKFYNYDNNGIQQSGYVTSLNMNFYNGTNALAPLGSAAHPFRGNINGNDLTVSNLHITGEGRTDIGIFGYVAASASIHNLYFDNVDIDIASANINQSSGTGHTAHGSSTYVGYIAGHVHDTDSFTNVYINNVAVRNSVGLGATSTSNFGYFGYSEGATSPNIGEEAYKQSFHASDVYDYLDANYSSISGASYVTRNTEYEASGSLGDAIGHTSGHYTFNTVSGKSTSLATAGYQHSEQTYIAQYKNGNNYNMMTGASTTQLAPEDQTTAGSYVYYDSTNHKWIYYTAVSSGTPVQTHYNVFYLSYHGITAGTASTTYYLIYDNGSLGYTTTAPTSYASTPNYYFAFVTSIGTGGVSEIRDGTSNSYYIYSPSNEKYLYAPSGLTTSNRNTLSFGTAETIQSASCEQNMFAISGSSGTEITIDYGGQECKIAGYNYSGGYNDPKFRVTDGSNPAFTFVIHGDPGESGDTDPVTTWSFVKTDSDWTPAANDVIAIVNEDYDVAVSATQNNNNRGQTSVTISDGAFVPGSSVGRFKLGTNANYSGRFSLQDVTPDGGSYNKYLCASGANSSNKLTSTDTANAESNFFNVSYNSIVAPSVTRGTLLYNHSNSVFACYNPSVFTTGLSIDVYLYQSSTISIHYEGAYDVTEQGEGQETIETTSYDIYYYDEGIGTSSRAQLTSTFVTGWSLAGNTTYVTIAPEITSGWHLVESQSDLVVGEKYIIANNTNNLTAGTFNIANGYLGAISSTFSNDKTSITSVGANTYEFVINGNSTDGYSISCSDGLLYANDDTVNFVESGIGKWNITINNGAATITVHGNTTYKLQYNSSRFKTYSSNQSAIQLYRYDTTEPQYIGDKIGNGYNPDYIDVVGTADVYSSYVRMNGSVTRTIVEGNDLNQHFYNTKYAKNAMVIRIPNRGSLDYGTIAIDCGSNLPVFLKSNSANVTLASVDCDETDGAGNYMLYLNKYNIYQLCYCTLNSSGNINGYYDASGDEVFSSGTISEFVLVLGAPSATNVDIENLDITFSTITGNYGDFDKVGFRDSPNRAPGEIFSFTYTLNSGANAYVYAKVVYDANNNAYHLYFKSSAALTLYLYNYDANRARVYLHLNGAAQVQKIGPYNAVSVSAMASPGSGGWTSY